MEWKLALAQHPMYFIIKEDSYCAERLPPEGEPTIERYIDRVRQNLVALRRYPFLKIGFEWSGLELEQLAIEGPDVFQEMCALAQEGRVAFYNGTYAQPHLQTLSAEANVRQFTYGMRVYRELCGHPVHVYAHQEASVHDQVPQLLRTFGINYAIVPAFASTLGWLDEGELEILASRGPHFMEGHEFVTWRGLDGTEVPLYLHQPMDRTLDDFIARETMLEKLRVPPILLSAPDMISIDNQWIAEHKEIDIVLLDVALPERLAKCPPRARARFYTNWSYIEGVRAEELSRHNWCAEAAALQAEGLNALAFALLGRPAQSTDSIWKSILATQHHDVYWAGSTELKDKSLRWLQEATISAERSSGAAAGAIVDRVNCAGVTGQALVVFGTLPHAQEALVTLEVPQQNSLLVDRQGQPVPTEVLATDGGSRRITFLARMPGLGYTTYWLRAGTDVASTRELDGPLHFENASFRTIIQPDGAFTSLVLLPSGDELLASDSLCGNQLAAADSTGLSPRHEGTPEYRRWDPPALGTELRWEPTGATSVRQSPLGTALTVCGQMGERVRAELTVMLYHHLARIDLTWAFTFDEASIGTFYDDSSKLRVHWPLAFSGDIRHDIAFGVIKEWEGRPFFPASWTDISDGTKGFAYFHRGTPKHYVEGRTLVNLFAWGEDTEAFGSRIYRVNNPTGYDQRLRGTHDIRCAVYPHTGDWRSANVVGAARDYGTTSLACLSAAHAGDLPSSMNLLSLTDPNTSATSVRAEDTRVICRLYAATGEPAAAKIDGDGLSIVELRTLAGERVQHLTPYTIGELVLSPARRAGQLAR
jgi:alpha-mannosidase